jgi:A/G-specific adenine glycosylase
VKPSPIGEKLLSWYELNQRDLPWRKQHSPYAIWVSEIMLQQTRVETVIPYFQRWMQRFPDVEALAQSSLQEVLSIWEGLGYYSRARNLHKAAQIIVNQYGGRLPDEARALRSLPGIGDYTAGAIASIAFGRDAPALDGNIRRVLARLDNMSEPARSPAGERRLWELAARLLPAGKAGDFNQALMDLGATLCTPQAPDCQRCPLSIDCAAYQLDRQEQLPVTASKAAIPHYTVTAAVIQRDGQVLITQRPANGLLGSLWEFPGGKVEPGEDLAACLQREIKEELEVEIRVSEPFGEYRHAYTHFRVTLHAFLCQLCGRNSPKAVQVQDLRWVKTEELADYPMGKIDRQIARRLNESTC